MPLPKFRTFRPGGDLSRLEDNVAEYARALTDERTGLLAHGLTLAEHAKGRVFRLKEVTPPDEWVPISLLNGFVALGATQFGSLGVRCDDAGNCEARGVIARASAPASGTTVFSIPTGYVPSGVGDKRRVVEAGGSAGGLEVVPTGVVTYLWGGTSLIDLSALQWHAASGPVMWPSTSQLVLRLGEDFHGEPEVVRVEVASTADGTRMGPLHVWWKSERLGGLPVVRVMRIGGLRSLIPYSLTLSVLSA